MKNKRILFRDWFHSSNFTDPEYNSETHKMIMSPKNTITSNAIICILLPTENSQIASETDPEVFFWNTLSEDNQSLSEFSRVCQTQFSENFPKTRFHCKQRTSDIWVSQFLQKAKERPNNQRILIYYYNYINGIQDPNKINFYSQDMKTFSSIDATTLIESARTPSAFVFDCDNSGALLDRFHNLKVGDYFAFFSCARGQKNPRPSGLPTDLFTSCLSSAPRIALIWHSRHFYHFKDASLKPLDIFDDCFFTESSSENSQEENDGSYLLHVYSSINQTLKRVVESMAFEILDPDTFTKLFRVDATIAQFFVNFIFACRIFESMNVQPVSFPSLPSFSSHPMWNSFDMCLDSELFKLQPNHPPPPLSRSLYLSQVLVSFETLVSTIRDPDHPFIHPISFMSMLLSSQDPKVRERSLKIFAKYVDLSYEAIDISLHFQVVSPVIKMLASSPTIEACFIILKIIPYAGGLAQVITEKTDVVFSSVLSIFPQSPIPIALVIKLITTAKSAITKFLQTNWQPVCLSLLDSHFQSVRLWNFLLLSILLNFLSPNDVHPFAEKILESIETCDAESSFAALECMPALSKAGFNEIVESVFNDLSIHISPLVRKHVITVSSLCGDLMKSYEIRTKFMNDIDESVKQQILVPKPTDTTLHDYIHMTTKPLHHVFEIGQFTPIDFDYVLPPYSTPQTLSNKITTKIRIYNTNEICFGDENGYGKIYRNPNEVLEAQIYSEQQENDQQTNNNSNDVSISSIQILENGSDPLYVAINNQGETRVMTTDGLMRCRFKTDLYERKHDKWSISINQTNANMIAYTNDDTSPIIFDLAYEQRLGYIGVKGAIEIAFSQTYSREIGICTKKSFLLHDTRSQHVALALQFPSELVGMAIDKGVLVATSDGSINAIDFRSPLPKPIMKSNLQNCKYFDAGDDIIAIGSSSKVEVLTGVGVLKTYEDPSNSIRSISCATVGESVFIQKGDNEIIIF